MVYGHGMRVKGVSPVADTPELKLPGDQRIANALSSLEQPVPKAGPEQPTETNQGQ